LGGGDEIETISTIQLMTGQAYIDFN